MNGRTCFVMTTALWALVAVVCVAGPAPAAGPIRSDLTMAQEEGTMDKMDGVDRGVTAAKAKPPASKERFIPVSGLSVVCDALPVEAESIAAARFVREVFRITGITLPIACGGKPPSPCIRIGNRSSLGDAIGRPVKAIPLERDGADIARQSYIVALQGKGRATMILAAGLGAERTAKGLLGVGYALGELLRRLDVRKGVWGFALPAEPIIKSPAVANRTLYIMNSSLRNPGLSIEHFSDEEIDDYVDRLVEARYSRICHWQWSVYYLYPGNAPAFQSDRQLIHRAMRRVYDRARRRGLEVYHMLTPSHVEQVTDPSMRATGYYAPWSICWSRPDARDLALKMAQLEMEYYGPVDGYMVWFYDPGGCFCTECAEHQAERLFDQLMGVVERAATISPGARFQAGLWPTWAFAKDKERIGHPGRGYTEDEVKNMVGDFLKLCRTKFGPRELTILDSCEGDETNIYNGNVDPKEFKRSGFMYTALGMASEQTYPFALFRLRYLTEQMGRARDRGLEEAQIFIQYSATNFPGVFAFADTLYETGSKFENTADRLASALAKGPSREPFLAYLTAMEDLYQAQDAASVQDAIRRIEDAAGDVSKASGFVGSLDWLKGHTMAQTYYAKLAQAGDDAEFNALVARFKEEIGAIPMYRDYAARTFSAELARRHVTTYWSAARRK